MECVGGSGTEVVMERISEGSGYTNRIEWWKLMIIMNMGGL